MGLARALIEFEASMSKETAAAFCHIGNEHYSRCHPSDDGALRPVPARLNVRYTKLGRDMMRYGLAVAWRGRRASRPFGVSGYAPALLGEPILDTDRVDAKLYLGLVMRNGIPAPEFQDVRVLSIAQKRLDARNKQREAADIAEWNHKEDVRTFRTR